LEQEETKYGEDHRIGVSGASEWIPYPHGYHLRIKNVGRPAYHQLQEQPSWDDIFLSQPDKDLAAFGGVRPSLGLLVAHWEGPAINDHLSRNTHALEYRVGRNCD
jgi:hypothetical protein